MKRSLHWFNGFKFPCLIKCQLSPFLGNSSREPYKKQIKINEFEIISFEAISFLSLVAYLPGIHSLEQDAKTRTLEDRFRSQDNFSFAGAHHAVHGEHQTLQNKPCAQLFRSGRAELLGRARIPAIRVQRARRWPRPAARAARELRRLLPTHGRPRPGP